MKANHILRAMIPWLGLVLVSAFANANGLSWDEMMRCSGAPEMVVEAEDVQALKSKYNEIQANIDAIDERKAMALVNGTTGQDESSKRAELVANAAVIEPVAQKKEARFNKWYFDCSMTIAKQKRAKIEAERKRKEAKEAKLQEQAKLQEAAKQKAQMKRYETETIARSKATSAATQGEVNKYAALIKAAVERFMILDPSMRGKNCIIGVKLASSGTIISVDNGHGDPAVCVAGKAALRKANHLPVPKEPAAFEMLKEFNLKLEPKL